MPCERELNGCARGVHESEVGVLVGAWSAATDGERIGRRNCGERDRRRHVSQRSEGGKSEG